MKIEPVRGWVGRPLEIEPGRELVVFGHQHWEDDEIPVLVIPLDSESIQEAHKKVVLSLMNDDVGMYGQLALRILAALGITEAPLQ